MTAEKDPGPTSEAMVALGVRVLGSESAFMEWIEQPCFSLEGRRPVELMPTAAGSNRVWHLLLAIEGGGGA